MGEQHAPPLGELRLIREDRFSLPIMVDHDHGLADIYDFATAKAERRLIAHLAVSAYPAKRGLSSRCLTQRWYATRLAHARSPTQKPGSY